MNEAEIIRHLKKIPLFQGLTDAAGKAELRALVPLVHEMDYQTGDLLFGQGDLSNRLYLIVSGQVRLTRLDREGLTYHLRDLGADESVGETGLLVGDFHDATAEILTPTHVLYLEREEFSELYATHPHLRHRLKLSTEVSRRRSLRHFEWLRPDELVIFAEQRHWIYLLRAVLLLFIPLGALLLWSYWLVSSDGPLGLTILAGGLTAALFLFIVWKYFNWRDDFFVLTTQRVVHSEIVWPVRKTFEEGALDTIQDAHEIKARFIENLLDFGDLILQTAGETVQIDFTGVPAPARLRELVFREIERQQAREELLTRKAIREKLKSRLEMMPPPPLSVTATPSLEKGNLLLLAGVAIRDYFFPSSWSVSEDKTIIYWRRFWLPGFIRNLSVFVPFAVIAALGVWYFPKQLSEAIDTTFTFWLWLLVESVLFALLLWAIEDWRNDYFQITPTRMIMVDCKPLLLSESRRETILGEIQNISFDVPDIMARFFKYGNVMLETAGATGKFELKWVRYPQKIQAEISSRKRAFVEKQRKVEAQRRQEELLSWFAVYDDLRQKSTAPADPGEAGTGSRKLDGQSDRLDSSL